MRTTFLRHARLLWAGVCAVLITAGPALGAAVGPQRPSIILILADDLGFSDLGCYGSEIATPNLDRLAAGGVRFTQFYNCARCCPTRAAVLTGLYPHQAGVGHMLQEWAKPAYTSGLNERSATIAEMLREAGYRTYMVGKWHVGPPAGAQASNRPIDRGFERFYGTGGGGNYFAPQPLVRDAEQIKVPEGDYYITDDLTDAAVRFIEEHARTHKGEPFLLHLCYTAPHFPLHAKAEDIARYRGKYKEGWDTLREHRYGRQKELGISDARWPLSPRDPMARAWADVEDKEEWDLRMAVFAAMVDCMDRGIGRVCEAVKRIGAEQNTIIMFLSDNGSSAEALEPRPDRGRSHQPGAITGTKESYRCLEVGWANAGNTPFREHKMWVHEGGISTPLIAYWPAGIPKGGFLTNAVGHVIDLMPTCLELAGAAYPTSFRGRELHPLEGRSIVPILRGSSEWPSRTLYWEHEGNRAVRQGKWKLVAAFKGAWELYDMEADRTETNNLAAQHPDKARELADLWQSWADRASVKPWQELPGGAYKPSVHYRKKSEPVPPR